MSDAPLTLLGISGSLRTASSNTAVLQAAALLLPPGIALTVYDGLGTLPHFNPDLDGDTPPPPVQALRSAVGRAAGLVLSSPEYAHGIAGTLKNGLDWLVRSTEFPAKPVMIVNASPRATHAEAQMREILRTMSARLVDEASLDLPLLGRGLDAAGIAADPALGPSLRGSLARFVASVRNC